AMVLFLTEDLNSHQSVNPSKGDTDERNYSPFVDRDHNHRSYFVVSQIAIAEEWNLEEKPWEKFGVDLGVFLAGFDSSFRLGTGIGVDIDVEQALEYTPWKHVGIGLGFDTFGLRLEADGEDWPGIDLKGNVDFNYAGLQLYLRLFD
ncbi:MAG: hypothetical protein V2I40_08175, partial [Desulfobacteraceae bacterium]|nr:hypothetical protein [Desulfobacteraceae bacterium]